MSEALECKLSEFVHTSCAGRDESHGHEHMRRVAENAAIIAIETYGNYTVLLDAVAPVAWLHDVRDHKYDHDGLLSKHLDEFLAVNFPETATQIGRCIDAISYSKEARAIKAGAALDYDAILGAFWSKVRNIVSDADKLEAIGHEGLERCREYTLSIKPHLTPAQLNAEVRKHAEEKLLLLKDHFIRTPHGKKMAEPLHQQMVDELAAMEC